jgi:hypothetical protein
MMSLESIVSMKRKAERDSRARGDVPTLVTETMLGSLNVHLRNIPFLGERVPRGWKRVAAHTLDDGKAKHALVPWFGDNEREYVQVDSSGFGAIGEPALTMGEFFDWVHDRGAGYGYAIVEVGQFQVVVGVYQQRGH